MSAKKADSSAQCASPAENEQHLFAKEIAHLAGQPRFARLSAEVAVKEAIRLYQIARAQIADGLQRKDTEAAEQRNRESVRQRIRYPERYPAPLEDFYRLVVRAKDKTEAQPRFKRYLLHAVNQRRQTTEFDPKHDKLLRPPFTEKRRTQLAEILELSPDQRTAEAITNRLKEWLDPSTRESLAKFCRPLLQPDSDEASNAVGQELEKYCQIPNKTLWESLAEEYLLWWDNAKREGQRNSGRAGALAHKRRKKVAQAEAVLNLAAVVSGKVGAASAAEAKKAMKRLKKRTPAS